MPSFCRYDSSDDEHEPAPQVGQRQHKSHKGHQISSLPFNCWTAKLPYCLTAKEVPSPMFLWFPFALCFYGFWDVNDLQEVWMKERKMVGHTTTRLSACPSIIYNQNFHWNTVHLKVFQGWLSSSRMSIACCCVMKCTEQAKSSPIRHHTSNIITQQLTILTIVQHL